MEVAVFTFNDFQENTYLLFDDTKECIIIDPGCNTPSEEQQLVDFIEEAGLRPMKLINTHCHIDHILGNEFVSKKYDLELCAHKGEKVVLDFATQVAQMYGIPFKGSPEIGVFLSEKDTIKFGNQELSILFTPGHSPASISFYNAAADCLIAGDVLFQGSIGRTDLPGGDHETLLNVIKTKFFVLPDETRVYPGHGPSTTIGIEKKTNPFF